MMKTRQLIAGFVAFMSFLMITNVFGAIDDWNRLYGDYLNPPSEQQKFIRQLWIQLIFFVSLFVYFAYVTLEPLVKKPIQDYFEQKEKKQKEKEYLKLKKEQWKAYNKLGEKDRTPELKPSKNCDFLEQCLKKVHEEHKKPLCQR